METGTQLLSTGQVARRLGTSRQHVVDLCERGSLAFTRVGSHRRVPASAVAEMLGSTDLDLTRAQEQSLWLHRAVLSGLMTDPQRVLDAAVANIDRWLPEQRPDGRAAAILGRWLRLIGQGPEVVAQALTSRTQDAAELRQNSPFAGSLDAETRSRVLVAFNRFWGSAHPGATQHNDVA